MTAQTLINNIYTHIYTAATFNSILSAYFKDRDERDEFRQHMFLQVYKIPEEKIIDLYVKGDLRWFFAGMVDNQVRSNTSPWAKQRQNEMVYGDDFLVYLQYEEDPEWINKKKIIIDAINHLQGKKPKLIEDFDHFKWFYFNNMSYRDIERMLADKGTRISRHTVRTKVIRAEALIKNYIQKHYRDDDRLY